MAECSTARVCRGSPDPAPSPTEGLLLSLLSFLLLLSSLASSPLSQGGQKSLLKPLARCATFTRALVRSLFDISNTLAATRPLFTDGNERKLGPFCRDASRTPSVISRTIGSMRSAKLMTFARVLWDPYGRCNSNLWPHKNLRRRAKWPDAKPNETRDRRGYAPRS